MGNTKYHLSIDLSLFLSVSPLSLIYENHGLTLHNTISLVQGVLGKGAHGIVEQLHTAEIKGVHGDC